MSELKYYKLFHRTSALTSPGFISIVEFGNGDEVYLKSEADKVIAELKDVIHELQVDLEGAKAATYVESVDAGMRERRLKRALYKACANWAHFAVAFFSSYATKEKWHKMERKCLNKMEEYK